MTDTQPSPLPSPQPLSAPNCGTFATGLHRASQPFQFCAATTRTLEPASPAALRWNPPADPVEILVLWLKGVSGGIEGNFPSQFGPGRSSEGPAVICGAVSGFMKLRR